MKNINIKINPSRLRDGLLVLLLIVTLGLSISNSQTMKLGYVNSAKILQELPEAQEAQKKLDAMGKTWQDELEKMTKDLQTKYEAYQKQQGMMNEQAKLATQQDLVELEQKAYQYRTEKFGSDGELAKQSDKLLSPIKDKVLKVIQQVAKEEKVSFIFDRNEQIMVLLYGDPAYDYTFKVIDKLKRSK